MQFLGLKITNYTSAILFPKNSFFFIFCNLLFHLIDNDIKEFIHLALELLLFKDMSNMPLFQNMYMAKLRENHVYDIVSDDYGIL